MNKQTLLDKFRIGPWLILAIITSIAVGFLYPHQLGVLLWSLTKLCWGAYLGYWIDRSMFPYARPGDWCSTHTPGNGLLPLLMLRRVIIIAAAILALGLGV
ncbi:Putative inner membrane protein [Halomonas citrativorans]|uniref:Inner membrane protein n=1 Tax=Halomonas citrativorans TaxID=2742612 RepID=A0A1R4I3D7_9GAMM|nr:putative holin [Halomonas citrativorans]SJN14249.1 Putative inner membrane protein [Halomonas citrativorans]